MDASFWHRKWERGEIAFHEANANRFLTTHFERLNLPRGSRVFVPLCGKTRDIGWLLEHGYRVVGAELSELAVRELFEDLHLHPVVTAAGPLRRYCAADIDIFAGDIFDVSAELLGGIDAIYDRAALVALPASSRRHYAMHLIDVTHAAPQLLITYEYNQQMADGPPFSVDETAVRELYGATYALTEIARQSIAGGLKGKVASMEALWLLQKSGN